MEKILKPKAKAKQKEGGKKKVVQNSSQAKTRGEAAKAVGTSHDTLSKVKAIQKEDPELLKDIDDGKTTVNSAYNRIQKKKYTEKRNENKLEPLPNTQTNHDSVKKQKRTPLYHPNTETQAESVWNNF